MVTHPTITRVTTATMTAADRAYPCQVAQIKGHHDARICHIPSRRWYAHTLSSRVACFDTEQDATRNGYLTSSN
jgi:hypothetical protein